MVKKTIGGDYSHFDKNLEYDEEKYDIDFIKSEGVFLLRRIEDNKIIKIFSEDISFIVQVNTGDRINFVVYDYSDSNNKKLIHYIDYGHNHLSKAKELPSISYYLDECRVGDSNTFIVESDDINERGVHYNAKLYNVATKKVTESYSAIYNDSDLSNLYGNDILIVQNKYYSDSSHKITDTITYGIDVNNYRVKTPFWSELQQRTIPLYTESDAKKALFKYSYYVYDDEELDLESTTINYEVIRYLKEAGKHFEEAITPYQKKMATKLLGKE